jgi:hypothetical protein
MTGLLHHRLRSVRVADPIQLSRKMIAMATGMLALWLAVPAVASATATWSLKGVPITGSPAAATWKGKIKIVDHNVPIVGTEQLECQETAQGKAGTGVAGEVTTMTLSSCVNVKNCPEPVAEAVHTPWKSELTTSGETVQDKLTSGGSGAPDLKWECKGIGSKDDCSGTLVTSMTNKSTGVTAALLESEKLKCALGGAGSGTVSGSQTVEASGGGRLGAEVPPFWRVGGVELTEAKKVSWSGKVTLSDKLPVVGTYSVTCEETASGTVGAVSNGEVTKLTFTSCTGTGLCAGGATPAIEAIGLPWSTYLSGFEGKVQDAFAHLGMGLQLRCQTTKELWDECPYVPPAMMTNAGSNVNAEFPKEKISCTNGSENTAELQGSQSISLTAGGVLSVS